MGGDVQMRAGLQGDLENLQIRHRLGSGARMRRCIIASVHRAVRCRGQAFDLFLILDVHDDG